MAKGQHLTPYQKGIVNRYYQHLDALTAQKLGELVSELYLCTEAKQADKLWKQAQIALGKTGLPPDRVERVLAARSPEGLAKLVTEFSKAR
ncbi:MAG: hypothetical protein IBJ11_06230 [Phycisphaerales bacterium]|nr:hypothetical protein [Phycisphaerales bacterium]